MFFITYNKEEIMTPEKQALINLHKLRGNPYPGRGLVIGMDEKGQPIQVYWVMGRSANSRNRVFKLNARGDLHTAPADPSKVEDSSLIIYRAMAEQSGLFVVSNGDQTDTIIKADGVLSFYQAMLRRQYEPDEPNFTPRISGIVCIRGHKHIAELSVLRRSPFCSACDRNLYSFEALMNGLGHCITTYTGDGNPLPSFQGEPFLLPLKGNCQEIAESIWEALDEDNRVSLAVKLILSSGDSHTHVINKYEVV